MKLAMLACGPNLDQGKAGILLKFSTEETKSASQGWIKSNSNWEKVSFHISVP